MSFRTMFSVIIGLYLIFGFYAFLHSPLWLVDVVFSLVILIIVFYFRQRFSFTVFDFILINIALLVHNIGFFGLYGVTFFSIGYDSFVHAINGLLIGTLVFRYLHKTFYHRLHRSSAILEVVLALGLSVLLSLIVEFMEYTGFLLFGAQGPAIGLLDVGVALVGSDNASAQYLDTMKDILLNIIFSFFGILIARFRWLKDL